MTEKLRRGKCDTIKEIVVSNNDMKKEEYVNHSNKNSSNSNSGCNRSNSDNNSRRRET